MASTLKSIRVDNDVLSLMEEYRQLQLEMFGIRLSLADIINSALPEYITTETLIGMMIEPGKPIVSINEHGKMQQISFSADNCERIRQVNKKAAEMSGFFENSRAHHMGMTNEEILRLAEYIKAEQAKGQ